MLITLEQIIKIKSILEVTNWRNSLEQKLSELEQDNKEKNTAQEKRILTIKEALENRSFCLGEAPFGGEDGLNLAKILLEHVHILESEGVGVNEETATAVKNMLSHNFSELYDIYIRLNNFDGYILSKYRNEVVDSLVGEDEITPELIQDYMDKFVSSTDINNTKGNLNNLYKHFVLIDLDVLKNVTSLLKFIANLFKSDDVCYDKNAILLSVVFDDSDKAMSYIKKYADFSSALKFNESLFSSDVGKISILGLTQEKIDCWRKINNKLLDKDFIHYFLISAQIDKHHDLIEYLNKNYHLTERLNFLAEITEKEGIVPPYFIYEDYDKVYLSPKCFESDLEYFKALCKENNMTLLFDYVVYSANDYNQDNSLSQYISISQTFSTLLKYRKNEDNFTDIDKQDGAYNLSKLQAGDIKTLFIDQMIEGYKEDSSYIQSTFKSKNIRNVLLNKNACFYTMTKNNVIVAVIYCWIGKNKDDKDVFVIDDCIAEIELKGGYIKIAISILLEQLESSNFSELYISKSLCYEKSESLSLSYKGGLPLSANEGWNLVGKDNLDYVFNNIIDGYREYKDFDDYCNQHQRFVYTWFEKEFCPIENFNRSFVSSKLFPNLELIYKSVKSGEYTIDQLKDNFKAQIMPIELTNDSVGLSSLERGVINDEHIVRIEPIDDADSTSDESDNDIFAGSVEEEYLQSIIEVVGGDVNGPDPSTMLEIPS